MSHGFLLDTNVPSELTKPSPDPEVLRWLAVQDELHLSVISIGELRRGFSLLPDGKRRLHLEQWFTDTLLPLVASRILPITQSIGERWGILGADFQRRGTPLDLADGLIAATALEHNLTLVTRNAKDFAHLGLSLFNPWQSPAAAEAPNPH